MQALTFKTDLTNQTDAIASRSGFSWVMIRFTQLNCFFIAIPPLFYFNVLNSAYCFFNKRIHRLLVYNIALNLYFVKYFSGITEFSHLCAIYCICMVDSAKKRILTGLQPTGALHLGNYLGSVRQMVELQDKGEMFFFIADLHALTDLNDEGLQFDPEEQRQNTRHLLCASISLGIDPKESVVYRQSDFPQITELAWIFSCLFKHNFLTVGHAYKDAAQSAQNPGLGVFLYPVLMAADILIAGADSVPVGKDQAQHLELAREIARRFNAVARTEYFVEPQGIIPEEVGLIPGIDGGKMSKSKGNTLPIFDDDEVLRKKIMGIVTDSTPRGEPIDPKACLVCTYLEKVMPRNEYGTVANRCSSGDVTYKELKDLLVEHYLSYFKEARSTYEKLIRDEKYAEKVFARSRKKLDRLFTRRLSEVKSLLGLL